MPSHQPTAVEHERAEYLYGPNFFPKLCRWLERRTKDISDAHDIAYEAIIYVSREELPPDGRRVENRVFQKARRLLIDWSRRRKPMTADLSLSEPLDGRTEGPEKVRLELIESVRSAINSLSKTERECIQLTFYEGLGTTQIARRLKLSAATVKEVIPRALNRIRESLGEGASAKDVEGGRI
jgi:RNA polymerase sigma factor (sigma-70 family)